MVSCQFQILNFVLLALAIADAQNVAMSQSGVAVGTLGQFLLTRQGDNTEEIQPPGAISFNDISIDADNQELAFGLSVDSLKVCSYAFNNTSATLVNCAGSSFEVSPFTGISARGGTAVISGGVGGMTVFDYDPETGVLDATPRIENARLQVIGNPDVLMISSTTAALSSDIGGSPRFGTLIVDIQGAVPTVIREFRAENGLGFGGASAITPANFPFVNAIYETESSVYMYTANGGMAVQDPNQDGGIIEISPLNAEFLAVTVAVNQEKGLVVFGGLVSSQSVIYIYDIIDPTTVELVGAVEVEDRITSVASAGSVVSYVTIGGAGIDQVSLDNFVMQPTQPPALSPTTPPIESATTPPMTSNALKLASVYPALLTVIISLVICSSILGY